MKEYSSPYGGRVPYESPKNCSDARSCRRDRLSRCSVSGPGTNEKGFRVQSSTTVCSNLGDSSLRGGQARFVVQGTEVAYLLIPVSTEEMQKIMSDNPGASGFASIIWMRHKSEAGNEKRQESSAEKWEVATVVSLINAAEFQYRFAHGIYADDPTLVRSGQLLKTRGQFTAVPKTVQSVSDPLPGYLIRLVVTPDGRSYQLSIQQKKFVDCALGIFSDETGIIFDGHIPKAGIMYGLDACGEPQSLR